MKDLFKLLRPQQYYKNLLIFVAIIFAGKFLNLKLLLTAILGFIILCLISSANYIINDIIDRKSDSFHPEKRNRPIAAGRIPFSLALIFSIFLILISLIGSFLLSPNFFLMVLSFFLLNLLYSVALKKEPFLDIIAIGISFILRAVGGALLVNVMITPWLIICVFFLSLFLATGKRYVEKIKLGEQAAKHKVVLKYYSLETLKSSLIAFLSILIVSYTLYSFLGSHRYIIITLPVVIYILTTYFRYILQAKRIASNIELVFKNPRLASAILVWLILIIIFIYL
ncbi:decaprenyl-phosphate phosphoribosyltransferase [Candidatus Woesearchaeota archaeon]|nr:MAG: decaprenyl-phosphate phosphoribosyltransferase [Candidatus Woesearchaeota archaeon]